MGDRLTNRRRKEIRSLAQRKYRKEYNQTLVEGVRAVESAVEGGAPVVEIVVAEPQRHEPSIQSVCDRAQAPVYAVSKSEVDALSDVQTSQGLLAVVERQYQPLDALVADVKPTTSVLALDRVQDPGNVGTILRTAAWFGTNAVIAGPGTAGLYGPKVMRASMGGHWDLRLARTDDLADGLRRLRDAGCACYGADLTGRRVRQWTPDHPSVLVLGSEAHGISDAVANHLESTVAIPGASERRGVESLNVAVAAGVLVYEWMGGG